MSVENILAVLGWCMVVNFSIMLLWVLAYKLAPNFVYRSQGLVSNLSREEFDLTLYRLLANYKVAVLIFNLAPYLALRIVF